MDVQLAAVASGQGAEHGASPVTSTLSHTSRGNWFGHPKGLAFLAATEFWDRVSFHGMQALLVLYMVDQLLLPGHIEQIAGFAVFRSVIEGITGPLSAQALASQVFGLYIGLTYFTPVIGGYLGDRFIGRRNGVALGALLMTAGHASMALDRTFLLALLLLILGAGLLRGNLAAQIGTLYGPGDRRRDSGFQIYYGLLNLGAFLAPLVTGALAKGWGWHYGFAFAGVGMFLGLLVYLAGGRHVPRDVRVARGTDREPLTGPERRVIATLVAMLPIMMMFWIGQSQIWNTYNVWARDHVQLEVGTFAVPVPWLQALDSLCVVVMMPPLLWLWKRQAERGREPDELAKLAMGCLVFGAGLAWLGAGHLVAGGDGKVPLPWVVAFHFISNVGYLFFAPTAVAFVSRVAPPKVNAMMIGVSLLAIFAGSTVSGRLGGLYESTTPLNFWLLHAAITAGGGMALLVFGPLLRRRLEGSGPLAREESLHA